MDAAGIEAQGRALVAEKPIGFDLRPVRELAPHELAVRFAFGFGVSVLAGTLALCFGDRVAGLFLAFPAILPASLTLIEKKEGERDAEIDAFGAMLGSVALVAFALVSVGLLERVAVVPAELAALAVWLVTAIALRAIARVLARRLARRAVR